MDELDRNKIEGALKRAVEGEQLSGSPRLCEFLTYVVAEALAGRADLIRAKTIGMDVYGHSADESGDRENVVRVDAGRLRRKLAEYYAGPGATDPARISLPTGGYAPHFEFSEAGGQTEAAATRINWNSIALVGAAAATALTAAYIFWPVGSEAPALSEQGGLMPAERQALFDKSPTALQAYNLSEQGRDIIFPSVDRERLAAALTLFERSIELDGEYFGGHAGASQVLATQAVLSPPGNTRDGILNSARSHAERAVELSPTEGWSQSAVAWVAFAERDFEVANARSIRARELAPGDPHVLEFDSLIALFSGEFDRVLDLENDPLAQRDDATRFVFRNAYASAHFHVGEFARAAELFERASSQGGPVSPVTVSYLIAAHHEAGNFEAARKAARELHAAWPEARVDKLFLSIFRDRAHARQIIDALLKAGWTPGGGGP